MISSKPTELKLLRIKAGYSARQLAKVCALNYATIATAEKNQREVTPKTAKSIADALGVPIERIFDIQIEEVKNSVATNEND